jgi:hypothetical protein
MRWLCWRQSFTVESSVAGAIVTSSTHFSPASTRVRPSMVDSVVAKCAHYLPDDDGSSEVPVVCTTTVDYSTANEYVRAHYGESRRRPCIDFATDGHCNGRALQSSHDDERGMMNEDGFAIIESPMIRELDWTDVDDIRDHYLPELERILMRKLFPSHAILMHCFWNPIIRGAKHWIYHPAREVVAAAMISQ